MKNLKINVGCGSRPLKNFINIDFDDLRALRKRYPNRKFSNNLKIKNWNIFSLPLKPNSVSEINSDALIEHLSFLEEPKFFQEMVRVLKPGGKISLSTVDFEKTVKVWLKLKDDWKGFFKNDKKSIIEENWFDTYTYNYNNRWGYITATLYGSQNGKGQFHKNCYTKKKLLKICNFYKLKVEKFEKFRWQKNRDYFIRVIAKKL